VPEYNAQNHETQAKTVILSDAKFYRLFISFHFEDKLAFDHLSRSAFSSTCISNLEN
jgi:hypothetical protein